MKNRMISALSVMAIVGPVAMVLAGGAGGPGAGGGAGGGGFGGGAGGAGGGGFGGGAGGGAGGFGGGAGGGAGGFGGGQAGGFNMIDMVRQQAGFTDDEWKVIQPKLQAVMDAQAPLRTNTGRGRGGMGGMGGAGGPGGMGGPGGAATGTAPATTQAQEPVAAALAALNAALQDANAAPDLLKARVTALRDARAQARKKLAASQVELQKVVTVRQEAVLVTMGYLE